MTKPLLFDYWRSSASYRVRIALHLKGIEYDRAPIDLAAGAQKDDAYRTRNPQRFVPMLEVDGQRLTQSLAICDWLDSVHPLPPLLPTEPAERATVLAMTMTIAADIHPLNNLRILKHLTGELGADEGAKNAWIARWIGEGFSALEAMAAARAGTFLSGEAPGLADVFLVPQIYNARRFGVALDAYPALLAADAEACRHPAFAAAHPDNFKP